MTDQQAFEIVFRLFLLCGLFFPLAMCQGFKHNEQRTAAKKSRRVSSGQRPGKLMRESKMTFPKAKTKARRAKKPKWHKAEPLNPHDQIIYDTYKIKQQFVTT